MTARRRFIGGVACGLLAGPLDTVAQTPTRIARIGVLANSQGPVWDGFRRGLVEHGYVEGRTVAIEWRWADGKVEQYPALAAELVQSKVDLIVTSSTQAAQAAKQATSSIPVVMLNAPYPDKTGLVESLTRPGGNLTGFSNVGPDLAGIRLQSLKEIAPKISRVGLLWNPANPVELYGFREMTAAAAAIGITILSIEIRAPDDLAGAFSAAIAGRADAVHAFGNPVAFKHAQSIVDSAAQSRLPSSFEERGFVAAGGLISYGPSFYDLYRRAATYVDKILKGAKPGELPIQSPTTFELVINSKTAKTLGLAIPNALLLRTTEVI